MTSETLTPSEERAHQEALTLLGRTQGVRMEVEQARSHASPAGRARLANIIASLSGAEVRLTQAAEGAATGQPIDLSGIEALLGSTEQEADLAAGESAANTAGAAARIAAATYAATHGEVQSVSTDLFERKIFDRYLQFDNPADEQEYRQREAARHQEIAHDLGEHTLTGDYHAGLLEERQLDDAGVHGATKSPQYQAERNKLHAVLQQQKAALDAQAVDRQQPSSSGTAIPSQDGVAQAPVVTVRPEDMGVDLASIGVTADPATHTASHGLPDQTRVPAGKSNGRG